MKTLEETRLGLNFSREDILVSPFLCIDRLVFRHISGPSSLSLPCYKTSSQSFGATCETCSFEINPYSVRKENKVNFFSSRVHPLTIEPLCFFVSVQMTALPHNLADSFSVIWEVPPFACRETFAQLILNVYLDAAFYTPATACLEWIYGTVNWDQFVIVNKSILRKNKLNQE